MQAGKMPAPRSSLLGSQVVTELNLRLMQEETLSRRWASHTAAGNFGGKG